MFELLPDKADSIASNNSPAMLLVAVVLSAFGGGVLLGIFLGRHFGNPLAAVEGVGFLLLAIWYAYVLLRRVPKKERER